MSSSDNYMSNKKLIVSHLHPQLTGLGGGGGKLHNHTHQHAHLHSHLGSATNSYLSPFGATHTLHAHQQTGQAIPPPILPPSLGTNGGVTATTLTDVERFSEYSQRTSRGSSSYKSSPPGSSGGGGGSAGGLVVAATSAAHHHFSNF